MLHWLRPRLPRAVVAGPRAGGGLARRDLGYRRDHRSADRRRPRRLVAGQRRGAGVGACRQWYSGHGDECRRPRARVRRHRKSGRRRAQAHGYDGARPGARLAHEARAHGQGSPSGAAPRRADLRLAGSRHRRGASGRACDRQGARAPSGHQAQHVARTGGRAVAGRGRARRRRGSGRAASPAHGEHRARARRRRALHGLEPRDEGFGRFAARHRCEPHLDRVGHADAHRHLQRLRPKARARAWAALFSGPLDNPGLDVRAARSIEQTSGAAEQVRVGVELVGTVQAPRTRVFSTPQ